MSLKAPPACMSSSGMAISCLQALRKRVLWAADKCRFVLDIAMLFPAAPDAYAVRDKQHLTLYQRFKSPAQCIGSQPKHSWSSGMPLVVNQGTFYYGTHNYSILSMPTTLGCHGINDLMNEAKCVQLAHIT